MDAVVLELADVTFRRDGKQIIDGISLTVQRGEHWALLGPNGAGKSTLLGFCAAVTFPTSGTVHVLGEQMGRVDLAQLRRSIGHVNPRHQLLETIDSLDESIPTTTTHALLIAGRTVAMGPARSTVTRQRQRRIRPPGSGRLRRRPLDRPREGDPHHRRVAKTPAAIAAIAAFVAIVASSFLGTPLPVSMR